MVLGSIGISWKIGRVLGGGMEKNIANRPVGGYFELELGVKSNDFHQQGIFLNSGRNALEYVVVANGIKKLYVPKFTCKVVLEPLRKHGVSIEFYNINDRLEIDDEQQIGSGEFLLYTNYFGIKDGYVKALAERYQEKLIVDNAQALFADPIGGTNVIYSPRKFVGMPDGGIAYSCKRLDDDFEGDVSYDRFTHLLKRHELLPIEGYSDYRKVEYALANRDIMWMSELSKKIFRSLDVRSIIERRRSNFEYLDRFLSSTNQFVLPDFESFCCPMVYPYYSTDENLRKKLISNDVFVATYWPNVFEWCENDSVEYRLALHLLPLPIDQRYGFDDMDRIIDLVLNK